MKSRREGSMAWTGGGQGMMVMGVSERDSVIQEVFQTSLESRSKPDQVLVASLVDSQEKQQPRLSFLRLGLGSRGHGGNHQAEKQGSKKNNPFHKARIITQRGISVV